MSRVRLERFAALQHLTVTVENGPPVIGYLRTTRRWRAAGFLAGLIAYLALNVLRGGMGVGIGFACPFIGWYVGAMVAETRISCPAHRNEDAPRPAGPLSAPPRPPRTAGPLTAATRSSRTAGRLSVPLSPLARFLSVTAMAFGVLVPLYAVAPSGGGTDGTFGLARIGMLLAAAVTLLSGLLQRRIATVTVSERFSETVAAELAMRSRSLHVLSAGAPVFLAAAVGQAMTGADGIPASLTVTPFGLLFLVLAGVAWYTATRPLRLLPTRPSPL
ncbi:hypothetical protein [Streptosporangium carneum]|uniref:hypothetical protein n=1 Tax=Streptosporangium carneum TaxID=47481 RepID=UPI0022F2C991|nr:hypothetical protein [Streptosporangium carneum]